MQNKTTIIEQHSSKLGDNHPYCILNLAHVNKIDKIHNTTFNTAFKSFLAPEFSLPVLTVATIKLQVID